MICLATGMYKLSFGKEKNPYTCILSIEFEDFSIFFKQSSSLMKINTV